MYEIRSKGSANVLEPIFREATTFIGPTEERLAMTTMVPGDVYIEVDETTLTIGEGWMYSGNVWCK